MPLCNGFMILPEQRLNLHILPRAFSQTSGRMPSANPCFLPFYRPTMYTPETRDPALPCPQRTPSCKYYPGLFPSGDTQAYPVSASVCLCVLLVVPLHGTTSSYTITQGNGKKSKGRYDVCMGRHHIYRLYEALLGFCEYWYLMWSYEYIYIYRRIPCHNTCS